MIDVDYHLRYFEELAKRLKGHTNRCVISFVDLYKKTVSNTRELMMKEPTDMEMHFLAHNLSSIAKDYGMEIVSCSESIDLDFDGVRHGCCIDRNLIEEIVGYKIDVKKDKNQRKECGCVESVDLGAYNTCLHSCKYCYANFNNMKVQTLSKKHNPLSTLLVGDLDNNDILSERKVRLLKSNSLF